MLPRIHFLSICSLLFFVSFLLSGCGSGGGSSGGILSYTGLTEPAQITDSSAEELATSSFEGGTFINAGGMTKSQSSAASGLASERILASFSITIREALYANKWTPARNSSAKVSAGTSNGQGDNSCAEGPGKFEYSLTYYPDYKAKAVFVYSGYCSRGIRLTGSANVDLLYDTQTEMLSEFMISFGWLRIQSSAVSAAAGGSILVYDIFDSSYKETVNMLVLDEVSSKTFKTNDLKTINTMGSNYFETVIVGGVFYHPDYGYVNVRTNSPIRYFDDAALPYNGNLQITGYSSTNALLTFYSSDRYRVQADRDGNGSYEMDSGMKAWDGTTPRESMEPAANAGADQKMLVGSTVTLDGSGSVSYVAGAPLTYRWSIVSAPGGSSATFVNSNNISPGFTPDMGGVYVIELTVNDGISESQPDHVLIDVRNDTIFAPYQVISSFRGAKAVTVGDLNDDGRDDVALVMGLSFEPTDKNRLHIFLQNTSGGLDPAVKYEVNAIPETVVAGDFNHDGRTDLVVGTWNGITVFLQNDSGGLVSSTSYATNARRLVSGDFNNDGRLDVISSLHVFPQSSSGTFSAPVAYTMPQGADFIEAGDVNGDGLVDLVISCGYYSLGVFATLLQKSEGTFDAPIYYQQNAYSEGLAVGDVNGDNRDDIFMTLSAKIGVFLQNEQGVIGQQVDYPAYYFPGPVLIDDVTRDGRNEVLVLHYDYALDVYLQGDSWNFGGSKKYALPSGSSRYDARALAAGDLNGDGRKDIAIADSAHGLVVLYNIY